MSSRLTRAAVVSVVVHVAAVAAAQLVRPAHANPASQVADVLIGGLPT